MGTNTDRISKHSARIADAIGRVPIQPDDTYGLRVAKSVLEEAFSEEDIKRAAAKLQEWGYGGETSVSVVCKVIELLRGES